jgi:hypothetical protein
MKTIPFTDLIQKIPGLLDADSAIRAKEMDSHSHAYDEHWTSRSCVSNHHRLLMSHSLTSFCTWLKKLAILPFSPRSSLPCSWSLKGLHKVSSHRSVDDLMFSDCWIRSILITSLFRSVARMAVNTVTKVDRFSLKPRQVSSLQWLISLAGAFNFRSFFAFLLP